MAREVMRLPFGLETGSLDSENRTLLGALVCLEMVAFCVCPGCLWFPWDKNFMVHSSDDSEAISLSVISLSVFQSSTDFWSPCH